MKLSDFVVKYLEKKKIDIVFGVTGGGAMHLNDSFGQSRSIKFIMTHHEQAASMAAESYTRRSGKIGVCHVTSGPGGTNAITGVVGAFIDSIPQLIISGQVETSSLINNSSLRQRGVQEVNITKLVKPIVKYCVTIKNPDLIKYELEKAFFISQNGRPGPVWIDIPLDIQNKKVNLKRLKSFKETKKKSAPFNNKFKQIWNLIKKAKRPTFVTGNGIHLSKSEKNLKRVVKLFNIPILTSWNTSDLFTKDHQKNIGSFGIFGDRASNFTIQNSDLIIILGCRMSLPQTGYNLNLFAPEAKIIYVDIDENEIHKLKKNTIKIVADVKFFLDEFYKYFKKKSLKEINLIQKKWLITTVNWKKKYPIVLSAYKKQKKINSFFFTEILSKNLKNNSCIVTDMGTSFTCTMQTFRSNKKYRLYTSSGLASMGFGLPGAVGAAFADKKNQTICITGDGGFMFNLQELQTIKHHNLDIKIFVLCNKGYLTMKLMQKKNFKFYIGSTPTSGITCPDFTKVAKAFGINSYKIDKTKNLKKKMKNLLNKKGSFICHIEMPEHQQLVPRLQTLIDKNKNFLPTPIDNLYPYLNEDEYKKNIFYKSPIS